MILRLIVKLAINALALAAAAWAVNGIHYEGFPSLLVMALIFGLVNAIIRPIVKILSLPLLILTLGLFTFVINGLMLLLSGWITGIFGFRFFVDGFWAAFWGAVIITFVSVILSLVLRPSPQRREE
jgi:putative membrane protein